ncbi:MAG: hypothetical protein OET18_05310, partial [Desulfobacterales bacterium]|nr:hypothetical protein [Desulfobacterales bacterium]
VISGTGKTNTRTGIEITSGNVNLSDMIIQNFSHGIGLVDGATTVSFNAGSDLMFKNTQNAFLFRDGFNLSNGGVNSFVLDSSDYLYETVDTTNIVGIFDVNKIEGTPLISYVNTDNNKRWIPQNNYINYIQGFHTPKSELLQTSYIVADSGKVPINSMVAGVTKGFDITVADVWTTIKLDTIYEDLTTNLFRANSDSTGVILNKGATLSINGSAVMQNTTGGNITAAVYWRLLKNQVEISTFNISKERTYPANSFDFMNSLKSKVIVNTNDTLYIQVQVDNNNVDINSPNGVFDGKSDFEIDITEIHIK